MKASKKNANFFNFERQEFSAKMIVFAFGFITLLFLAKKFFDDEFSLVINWWLVLLASGLAFMPLSMLVLKRFKDSGWLFSKVIGVAVSGWFMWFLASIKIMKFNEFGCWFSLMFCFAANVVLYVLYIKSRRAKEGFVLFEDPKETISHIALGEFLFLLAFIIWNYIKAFKPEAYGTTEKMMDYGFMKAMFKSDYMPPEDMWLAGQPINYYYVGQFMATFLTKLSNTGVEYGYNFSLNMLAAFGFILPCSIVYNVAVNHKGEQDSGLKDRFFPYFAAGISGLAVSIAGNLHYNIYHNDVPVLRNILGLNDLAKDTDYNFSDYWFPNATRFIGYNPDTADKTIHEFPSYSFVLGDLHAHVINIMFVLTVVALLWGLLLNRKKDLERAGTGEYLKSDSKKGIWGISFKDIFQPSIVLCGFFIGLFHTTNYWDYPIYFVICGAIILFMNCRLYNFSFNTLKITFFHAIVVLGTAKLVALPFTLNFDQIASQLNLCENHTPLFQLIILWGLPVTITMILLGVLIKEKGGWAPSEERKAEDPGKKNVLFRFIAGLKLSDMFILTLALCAIGLVLIPEVVYVKDIYSGDYKRANTMFKLAYQAFILFGMVMGYALSRFVFYAKKGSLRAAGIVFLVILIRSFGYFDNATKAWFGDYSFVTEEGAFPKDTDLLISVIYYLMFILFAAELFYLLEVKKKSTKGLLAGTLGSMFLITVVIVLFSGLYVKNDRYKHLNSGVYLQDENFDDYEAVNWIEENIEGRPVMLEANGLSYKYNNRISAITGLPTILGWRTHEWLWHSTSADGGLPEIVAEREVDVEKIYTSQDMDEVKSLLKKYNIEYIYIGGCEREKFDGEDDRPLINVPLLICTGSVCYPEDFDYSDLTGTFIIKVGND